MIIIDCETTGLDPGKNCIVSICARNLSSPHNVFYIENRICDGTEIDPLALQANGFTEAQITDIMKPTLKKALQSFFTWIEAFDVHTQAGQGCHFDHSFLKSAAERYDLSFPFGRRFVDIHALVYADHIRRQTEPPLKNTQSNINIDRSLNYVGLPDEPRPHDPRNSTLMLCEAYHRMIFGKTYLEEFNKYPIPEYLQK